MSTVSHLIARRPISWFRRSTLHCGPRGETSRRGRIGKLVASGAVRSPRTKRYCCSARMDGRSAMRRSITSQKTAIKHGLSSADLTAGKTPGARPPPRRGSNTLTQTRKVMLCMAFFHGAGRVVPDDFSARRFESSRSRFSSASADAGPTETRRAWLHFRFTPTESRQR